MSSIEDFSSSSSPSSPTSFSTSPYSPMTILTRIMSKDTTLVTKCLDGFDVVRIPTLVARLTDGGVLILPDLLTLGKELRRNIIQNDDSWCRVEVRDAFGRRSIARVRRYALTEVASMIPVILEWLKSYKPHVAYPQC